MAALAWEWISIKLSDGQSNVYDAVKYANDLLASPVYSYDNPVRLRFRVIGGNEGHNVKKWPEVRLFLPWSHPCVGDGPDGSWATR